MKKSLVVLMCLVWGAVAAKAQIFVEGLPLDSVHHGEYLAVEFTVDFDRRSYVLVESDRWIDREPFRRGDWLTNENGKRRAFETRIAALNYLVANGWDIAFVLVPDSRLLLRRKD